MKLNKFMMLAAIALAGTFVSCSEEDDYAKGKEAGEYDVVFTNEENLSLDMSATEFEVTLERADATGALTLPIEVVQASDCFTVPTSVTFADGETEASLTVKVAEDMKVFTDYVLSIRIPEKYTNPYAENADGNVPALNIKVVKQDFVPVALGEFTDNILFEESWEQVLEYSEYLGFYRMPDLIATGTPICFKWDGTDADDQKFVMCDMSGKEYKAGQAFPSGYVHKTYGMIMWNVLNAWAGYDSEDNAFYFPTAFTVSAGSFGSDYNTLEILETYEGWPIK